MIALLKKGKSAELNEIPKMYNSITDIPSETLHRELTRRGYNPSRRRYENENLAEIVKIG